MTLRSQPKTTADLSEWLRAVHAQLGKLVQGGKLVLSPGLVTGAVSKRGTGTIASGATSVTVTHGYAGTPTAAMIRITPTNNPTNDPGHIWVSNIDSETFDVNCRSDPGASGMTFAWAVDPV